MNSPPSHSSVSIAAKIDQLAELASAFRREDRTPSPVAEGLQSAREALPSADNSAELQWRAAERAGVIADAVERMYSFVGAFIERQAEINALQAQRVDSVDAQCNLQVERVGLFCVSLAAAVAQALRAPTAPRGAPLDASHAAESPLPSVAEQTERLCVAMDGSSQHVLRELDNIVRIRIAGFATMLDAMRTAHANGLDALDRAVAGTCGDVGRLHAELGGLRRDVGEIRAAVGGLRAEADRDVGGLRAEVGALRAALVGLRAEVGALRSELHRDVGGLSSEVGRLRAELHYDVDGLRREVDGLRSDVGTLSSKMDRVLGRLSALTA